MSTQSLNVNIFDFLSISDEDLINENLLEILKKSFQSFTRENRKPAAKGMHTIIYL